MNLGEIRNRVLRQFAGQYNDRPHILDLINEALTHIVDAGKLRGKTTISLLPGINQYPLPANFKAPGTLQDETMPDSAITYRLLDISENGFGYAIESGNIYIKPTPTANATLTHYYYKYATPLVLDSDIPVDIDSQYHHLLALYAIAMIIPALKHDTSTRYAIMAQNMYETRSWQMWTDGLMGFQHANERKNRSNKVNEKVVW